VSVVSELAGEGRRGSTATTGKPAPLLGDTWRTGGGGMSGTGSNGGAALEGITRAGCGGGSSVCRLPVEGWGGEKGVKLG